MSALVTTKAGDAYWTVPSRGPEGPFRAERRKLRIISRSQIPGRGRWYVEELEDNPRLAAAVELVLRSEDGITAVEANPLTGSLLVHYGPDMVQELVEWLIRRALDFGPMSREEFSEIPSTPRFSLQSVVAVELGCSALKLAIFGSCCPLVLAAAGLLFVMHVRD